MHVQAIYTSLDIDWLYSNYIAVRTAASFIWCDIDEMQNLMQPFIDAIAWADRIIVDIDCHWDLGDLFAHFATS